MTARDEKGRFVQGNRGGPGRPQRMVGEDYLAALSDAVPLDAWRRIAARAVSDAENGDAKARAWLSRYLLPNQDRLLALAEQQNEPALEDQRIEVEFRRDWYDRPAHDWTTPRLVS